ncbi:MAG TPA: JAB domain-containing protein [Planctomycetota bacterium]|jgi:DNA repair protein RadC
MATLIARSAAVANTLPIGGTSPALEQNLLEMVGRNKCPVMRSAADVADAFAETIWLKRNVLLAATIDRSRRLIHWEMLAGTRAALRDLCPASAFSGVMHSHGYGVILVQNHRSGRLEFDAAGRAVTRAVAHAGLLLGYPLVDHVIISQTGYLSVLSVALSQRHYWARRSRAS